MTGVVIVTHGELANELVRVTELIVGPQPGMRAVGLRPDEDLDAMKGRIADAMKDVESGDGVVVLTDMFGGTPSNISLPFHDEGKVEVVMGVNLPMLLKLASARNAPEGEQAPSTGDLATLVCEYGKKNIQAATDILKK